MGEELRRPHRLLRRIDFQRCYRKGRRFNGMLIRLHTSRGDGSCPRIGITMGRRIGKAVVRHRIKRWVREVFRRWPHRHRLIPVDIVAHIKPGAAQAPFSAFKAELEGLLDSLPRYAAC